MYILNRRLNDGRVRIVFEDSSYQTVLGFVRRSFRNLDNFQIMQNRSEMFVTYNGKIIVEVIDIPKEELQERLTFNLKGE